MIQEVNQNDPFFFTELSSTHRYRLSFLFFPEQTCTSPGSLPPALYFHSSSHVVCRHLLQLQPDLICQPFYHHLQQEAQSWCLIYSHHPFWTQLSFLLLIPPPAYYPLHLAHILFFCLNYFSWYKIMQLLLLSLSYPFRKTTVVVPSKSNNNRNETEQ